VCDIGNCLQADEGRTLASRFGLVDTFNRRCASAMVVQRKVLYLVEALSNIVHHGMRVTE